MSWTSGESKADVTRRSRDTNVSPGDEKFKCSTDVLSKTNTNKEREIGSQAPSDVGSAG